MEPEGSLPHSQMLATCPYPEPAQSSPYPLQSHFLKIHKIDQTRFIKCKHETCQYIYKHKSGPTFLLAVRRHGRQPDSQTARQPDSQCTCKVTFRRVRGNILAVEKQLVINILSVCFL